MDYWKVKTYRKETYLVKTIGLFVSCWLYTIHLKSFQKPCLILSNTCNFALESMPLRSILSLHSFWHILFRHGEKQQQQQKQTIYIYIYHQQEHIVHHMRIVRGIDCHVAISIAASQKLPFFRGGTCLDPATGRFQPSNTTTLLRCNLQANKVFSMANCDRLAKQFDVALTLGLKPCVALPVICPFAL